MANALTEKPLTAKGQVLTDLLQQRIVFLDGAMGTMIQQHKLEEADFRDASFAEVEGDLKGNNDLLSITRPEIIKEIHRAFLEAGSDIIETNTFSGTTIAQADYGLEHRVRDINLASARVAREVADEIAEKEGRPIFVAGAIGPTNRTASLSPDVNRPEYRATSYDELHQAYYEQIEALVEGGVDLLLPETVFDTLNLKACLHAIEDFFDTQEERIPVIISVTITDQSGRTLTGQTVEACWNSIRHAKPLCVGLNCALGADLMRPFLEELAQVADTNVHVYPNAGLPNPLSETGYDETPAHTSESVGDFAKNGLVNLVGGCCGTTPDHIRAIVEQVSQFPPRSIPENGAALRLSGLEALNIDNASGFINVGERTNVTGSPRFKKLIKADDFTAALAVAQSQVEKGAQIIDVNFDEGLLDGEACMARFLNLVASEPDITRVPVMIDSSKWSVIEAGLKCVQGKCIVNSISLKGGEDEFRQQARTIRRYGAAVIVMAFDETGQAATQADKVAIAERSYKILTDEVGLDPQDIIFDLNILTVATGMEEHDNYAVDFIEAVREVKKRCPGARTSGGLSNISFSFRGNNPVREAMHAAFLHHVSWVVCVDSFHCQTVDTSVCSEEFQAGIATGFTDPCAQRVIVCRIVCTTTIRVGCGINSASALVGELVESSCVKRFEALVAEDVTNRKRQLIAGYIRNGYGFKLRVLRGCIVVIRDFSNCGPCAVNWCEAKAEFELSGTAGKIRTIVSIRVGDVNVSVSTQVVCQDDFSTRAGRK